MGDPQDKGRGGFEMTYLEEHNPEFVRELLFLCALITIEEELKREELVPF